MSIPLNFSSEGGDTAAFTQFGVFVKLASLPSSATTLVDIKIGAAGYVRLTYDPTTHFLAEANYHAIINTLELWPGITMATGSWYWVSVGLWGNGAGGFHYDLNGQVYAVGGSTGGTQDVNSGVVSGYYDVPVSCAVGWGAPQSSSYAAFPNTAGNAMTELWIRTGTGSVGWSPYTLGIPAGPITVDGLTQALYHCDVTVGTNQTIVDGSGHGYDLTVAAGGNTIVVESPFT